MDDRIIGTWWLVALKNGNRYLTKANKVTSINIGFDHSPEQMRG